MTDTQAAQVRELQGERDALAKRLNDEDLSHNNTMEQRDHAETMADNLSAAIMGITGRDIGEHSSANCPWSNAFEHAEEYEAERDALAAHVKRQSDLLSSLVQAMHAYEIAVCDPPPRYHLKMMRDAEEALLSAPTASLARQKAKWQAGALEESARAFKAAPLKGECRRWHHVAARTLERKAAKLRRQAEGDGL